MPSTNACPGVDVNVIALACVAMIESATVIHPRERSARRNSLTDVLPRPRQNP